MKIPEVLYIVGRMIIHPRIPAEHIFSAVIVQAPYKLPMHLYKSGGADTGGFSDLSAGYLCNLANYLSPESCCDFPRSFIACVFKAPSGALYLN